MEALLEAAIPGKAPVRRGKVRELFEHGGRLLIVATDRISAYDVVMPNGIPGKGKVLTAVSDHWFDRLEGLCENHRAPAAEAREALAGLPEALQGRTTLALRCEPVLVECVARGYIAGSLYKEYLDGTAGRLGLRLPHGLTDGDKLPAPVFSPATKAAEGHDENISFDQMVGIVGGPVAEELRRTTLALYSAAADAAKEAGLILADAKLEFGWHEGRLLWIDEAFTPDSARYWEASDWKPGGPQPSFDKQFVRDWLAASGWDRKPPAPRLPDDVVEATRQKYEDCCRRLTGSVPGRAA
jgi:phosphoribosylaminoimidazole-succinocarboxamide synthase